MSARYTALPHQIRAIDWALGRKSGYVTYGTGTGKTGVIWTLAEVFSCSSFGRVLVVVPNSILTQFTEDAARWIEPGEQRDLRVLGPELSITQRAARISRWTRGILLLSHEALQFRAVADALKKHDIAALLVDEATRFRNPAANRTKALTAISRRSARVFLFSGTPVVKNPTDLWSPMKMIDPNWCVVAGQAVSRKELFIAEFCTTEEGFGGRPIPTGVRKDKEAALNQLLDNYRITCQLSDVRELPERAVSVRWVELSPEQRAAYQELKDTLILELRRVSDEDFRLKVDTYVARMLRLSEIAAGFARNIDGDVAELKSAKTAELIEMLQDPTPTIVFTWFRPEHALVGKALTRAGIDWTADPRAFQEGGGTVLLIQLAKGGFGLNLQRAVRTIYHSISYDLEYMLQSLDRNNRLTTEHPNLYVVYLLARGTVDERQYERLLGKATTARQLSRADALALLTE